MYPGADYTGPLAFPFHHVHGNFDLSLPLCCVLINVFRFRSASSVSLACRVFCVLAVCAVQSGHWVCAVCVCSALCALCWSCCASQCHAVPHLLFLQLTQKLSPRMRMRYTSVSFFVSVLLLQDLIIQCPSPFHFTSSAGRRVRTSSPVDTA